ncbi:MAG: hypothetical protein IJN41_04970, partial [Firmicutes bacterium]|nr:hypothetical protein [Bacillota bacterium]
MKKFIAMIMCLCMLFTLVACGGGETAPEAAAYKLGMGVELKTTSSKTEQAQVDATVATVVTDAEGKIVVCRIDCAQSKMAVVGGAVEADKTFKTKMELGDDYGMVAYGAAMAEWDAQTKAFEEFVVGKTAAEVEALETTLHNGHNISTDETLLAGCTMDIVDFKAAVVKACNDEKGMAFETADAFTLGVAAMTEATDSVAATAEANGSVNMYSYFGAAAVGADGKITSSVIDAVQANVNFDTAGKITSDLSAVISTKNELGDSYGLKKASSIGKEWYEQAAAYA